MDCKGLGGGIQTRISQVVRSIPGPGPGSKRYFNVIVIRHMGNLKGGDKELVVVDGCGIGCPCLGHTVAIKPQLRFGDSVVAAWPIQPSIDTVVGRDFYIAVHKEHNT